MALRPLKAPANLRELSFCKNMGETGKQDVLIKEYL